MADRAAVVVLKSLLLAATLSALGVVGVDHFRGATSDAGQSVFSLLSGASFGLAAEALCRAVRTGVAFLRTVRARRTPRPAGG